MPTVAVSGEQLLGAVKEMAPEEFDAFIEQALALRKSLSKHTLSARETELIRRINHGLPAERVKQYARLVGRLKKGTLTVQAHQDLLALTHEMESLDADRAAALVELAKLRRLPVRLLMKQMGIQTPAVHG